MKIISWNVNGIRAVYNKGFLEWITRESPDILCLQETKANFDQFPEQLKKIGYEIFHSSAEKKGYSGVSTFSREKFLDTTKMGKKIYDDEGRVLIHELSAFYLVNSYFPNGSRDHKRVPFKMTFCEDMQVELKKLREKKPVIITGDFNTAHHEIDLANPKTNSRTTGFLPIERAWMDRFIAEGWVDIFRKKNPDLKGAYTWWSPLNQCRLRNIGWRLDYFFTSSDLENKVQRIEILANVQGSDHCPVLLEI
jgi:exodeoxyribonuclease-3